MNKKQRLTVWIAICIAIGMYVYAPTTHAGYLSDRFSLSDSSSVTSYTNDGPYRFLWQLKRQESVNVGRLLIQYLLLAAVTTVLVSGSGAKQRE